MTVDTEPATSATSATSWRAMSGLLAAAAAVVLTVAGCSSGSSSPVAGSTAAASSGTRPGGSPRGTPPAAFGTIAAVAAGSFEIQNASTGQTTVDYSSTTPITAQRAATLAAVAAGECITATAAPAGSTASGAAPSSGTSGRAQAITASAVIITPATNGSCAFGGIGVGGQRASGATRPTDRPPSGSRSPRPGGARGFGDVVSGRVQFVTGAAITVLSTRRGPDTSSPAPSTSTTNTVDVTPATTYIQTVVANPSALVIGRCATVQGKADSTGAVSATRIAVSTPSAQGCEVAFGGGIGRGGSARSGAEPTPSG